MNESDSNAISLALGDEPPGRFWHEEKECCHQESHWHGHLGQGAKVAENEG